MRLAKAHEECEIENPIRTAQGLARMDRLRKIDDKFQTEDFPSDPHFRDNFAASTLIRDLGTKQFE